MIAFTILLAGAIAAQNHQDRRTHTGHDAHVSQDAPVSDQDVHDHGPDAEEAGEPEVRDKVAMPAPHVGHDEGDMSVDHGAMDHSKMDHRTMDHDETDHRTTAHDRSAPPNAEMQEMDHSAMGHTMPADDIPLAGPPPEAGSGPALAASEIFGAQAMQEARAQLVREHGSGTNMLLMADRAEIRTDGRDLSYLWDVQGWYGGDIDKLWIKSEGEGEFGDSLESADVEALWSHAIAPFFDAQVGVRQDLTGPETTYLALGINGLAPYEFELDATGYLSTKGDFTAKIEAELDQRVTQRLILQPRGELVFAAQDVSELGIGRGLSVVEAGLRIRYELSREFAPYIGVSHEWRVGRTGDFSRSAGEDSSATRLVAGIRAWF